MDVMRACLGCTSSGLRRQNRAQIEQLMLDAPQNRGEQSHPCVEPTLLLARNASQADERIQLVDGPVTLDAERILGDALPAGQAGLARVSPLGVNPIQRQARVVKSFFAHAFILCGFPSACRTVDAMMVGRFSFHARSAMPCDPEILKKVPLFALLDDDETNVLASQVEIRTFAPRQRIYKIGDPGGRAYVMVSGAVRITTIDEDAQEVVVDARRAASFSASRPCWIRRRTRPPRSRC